MMHEELIEQYAGDCTKHLRPWELWQFKYPGDVVWHDFLGSHPKWIKGYGYRRKEPAFVPEYFSGLNWRDAEHLVGKKVEVANVCDGWYGPWDLRMISPVPSTHSFQASCDWWVYLRTCPETHAHPTITIGGVELPRPETQAPGRGTEYWVWTPTGGVQKAIWRDTVADQEWLNMGIIHLTEPRAQEWASWWQNTVMAAVRG